MENELILNRFLALPDKAKKEALLFMEFLLNKYTSEASIHELSSSQVAKNRAALIRKNAGIVQSNTDISLEALRRENLYGEDER